MLSKAVVDLAEARGQAHADHHHKQIRVRPNERAYNVGRLAHDRLGRGVLGVQENVRQLHQHHILDRIGSVFALVGIVHGRDDVEQMFHFIVQSIKNY